jgi:hypothetical protein
MLKYPTLSSLAFGIFRSDRELSKNIAKITGKPIMTSRIVIQADM